MHLVMISFAAVAVSSCCLAAVFVHALHTPAQPLALSRELDHNYDFG
jgi:hypothetical protein